MGEGRRAGDDDARWRQHEREHDTAERTHRREHEAEQRSLELAANQVDRRLAELNELRSEVVKDRSMFLRVETYNAEHKALASQVDALVSALAARLDAVEKAFDRAEGAVNTWRWIAGFLGIGGVALIVWSLTTFGHP